MSSRDEILARLKQNAIKPEPRPEADFQPLTFTNPVEQFQKILQVAGANSVLLEKGEDVNEIIRKTYPEAKTIASNLPGINCATVNPDLLEDPRELNGTDVAVIRGEFGVLENGMVWIKQQKTTDPSQGFVFHIGSLGDSPKPRQPREQHARSLRPTGI